MNLSNNPYLKKIEKTLEEWDMDKGYLYRDSSGDVVLECTIDLDELNIPYDNEEEIVEALENYFEQISYYFEKSDGFYKVSTISTDNLFLYDNGDLATPTNLIYKTKSDFEIMVYALNWMHESGIFSGVYRISYYGDLTYLSIWDFDEYKSLSKDEETEKQEIETLYSILEFKTAVETRASYLADLPVKYYDVLPTILKEENDIEIIEIKEIKTDSITLTIEIEKEHSFEDKIKFDKWVKEQKLQGEEMKYGTHYEITLNILPQSIQYLKSL